MYASPSATQWQLLWKDIRRTHRNGPWCTIGNFNAVLNSEERSPLGQFSTLFADWVDDGMIDLGFNGPRFTWSHGNSATQHKSARLDRSLCNEQ